MLGDDDSVVAVVVLPLLAGGFGYLLLGPLGFFAGAAGVLVVGAMVEHEDESDRIAELESRVAELEGELEADRETEPDGSDDSNDA